MASISICIHNVAGALLAEARMECDGTACTANAVAADSSTGSVPAAPADSGAICAASVVAASGSAGSTPAAPATAAWLNLVYEAEYAEGDTITLSAPAGTHLVVQLDDALDAAQVYCAGASYRFVIPFGEKRLSYNPKAFSGGLHLLRVRLATSAEVAQYRNLAANSHDTAANASCFPHASANIETRGESVFAARNAIDGNSANTSHGNWPYESWGINRDPAAELHLDFGREVTVDKLVLVTRADFPHDSWWKQATVAFSDGSTLTLPMRKSTAPHAFAFAPRTISALTLKELIKDESDPSPFPALSQLEVYGCEAVSPPYASAAIAVPSVMSFSLLTIS